MEHDNMEHDKFVMPSALVSHSEEFRLREKAEKGRYESKLKTVSDWKKVMDDYPELHTWLMGLTRGGADLEKYFQIQVTVEEKEKTSSEKVKLKFFTKEHSYTIIVSGNYLSAYGWSRKPRAGEDWTRGNDLPDGSYSEETWQRILNGIVNFEMVRIVGTPRSKEVTIG